MDRSAVKAIVDREIGGLMEAMGVPHWKVEVRYEPCSNPEWMAMCHRVVDYNTCRITIDPDMADDERGVVRSLVHELAHVLLAPFDLYREAITQHIDAGTVAARQEARLWNFAVEQAVINIERLWRGGPPYWAAREAIVPTKKGGGGAGAGPGGKRVTTKSASKDAIGTNIAKLVKSGVPQKQAVAEAISIQRQAAKDQGKKPAYPKKKKKGK